MPLTEEPHKVTQRQLHQVFAEYDHTLAWLTLVPTSSTSSTRLNFAPQTVISLHTFLRELLSNKRPASRDLSDTYRVERLPRHGMSLNLPSKLTFTFSPSTTKELAQLLDELFAGEAHA